MTKRFLAVMLAGLFWVAQAHAAYYGPTPLGVTAGGTGLATLTAHAVVVGEGAANVALIGPGATAGVPLVSGGSSADPSFTTAVVAGGGTGLATLTAHAIMVGAGTSNVAFAVAAADSIPLWQSSSADPTVTSINDCTGAGKALSYAVATHTFGCNSITAGAAPTVATAASSASITLASTNLLTTLVGNTTVTTATLPSAVTVAANFRECIKDSGENFATHNVTLKSTAGTIDGVAAATGISLNQTWQEVCAISDGTNWYIE